MARNKMFTIRVDEAEHALFKGAARAVGISISEYARDAMLARMALEEAQEHEDEWRRGFPEVPAVEAPRVINKPSDVPGAVRRVASAEEARAFAPYSKERSVGRAAKKPKAQAEPAQTCRHGLLRCKVCGSL